MLRWYGLHHVSWPVNPQMLRFTQHDTLSRSFLASNEKRKTLSPYVLLSLSREDSLVAEIIPVII